jgi:hypothetical protein
MAAYISASSLYPVVREIDEEEYGTCCCIDGAVMSGFSLHALPLALPNQSRHQRSKSDHSNNSSKSAKRSLFQAKRRRSAVQRARSEGAMIDTSDTQTISTEAEEKKFEESFVLTRQVSAACGLKVLEWLIACADLRRTFAHLPFLLSFRQTRSFVASRPYYGNVFIANRANVIVSRSLIGVASDRYRSKRLWNERLACYKTLKVTWVLSKCWT